VIRIRAANAGDEPFVAALVPRFVEHGTPDGHAPETVIEGTARVLRDALLAPNDGDVFLIAESDAGEALGFVFAFTVRDFFTGEPLLHISEIAVARSGEGAGAALLDAVEARGRARGDAIVSLNVHEDNVAAQRLYRGRGYGVGHVHYVKPLRRAERDAAV